MLLLLDDVDKIHSHIRTNVHVNAGSHNFAARHDSHYPLLHTCWQMLAINILGFIITTVAKVSVANAHSPSHCKDGTFFLEFYDVRDATRYRTAKASSHVTLQFATLSLAHVLDNPLLP